MVFLLDLESSILIRVQSNINNNNDMKTKPTMNQRNKAIKQAAKKNEDKLVRQIRAALKEGREKSVNPADMAGISQSINAAAGGPARYGAAIYGQATYVTDTVPVQMTTGAKVKLSLSSRNNPNVIDFAKTHIAAITGDADFPSPLPLPATFAAKLAELEAAQLEYEEMKSALKSLSGARDRIRAEFDAMFTQRGTYVELTSGGNSELIQDVALPVKSASTPLGLLQPPIGLRTDLNGSPGCMQVRWGTTTGARAYLLECSLVLPNGVRDWKLLKVGGSNCRLTDLIVGQAYAFRVAAVGGLNGRSEWSLEVQRTAA